MVAIIACGAGSTHADDSPRDQAKKLFKAGEADRQAGRYDDAIAKYQQAYSLAPLPVLLFNIGQVYRLKGDAPSAIRFYQKYLTVETTGQAAEEARQHVITLNDQIRAAEEAVAKAKAEKAEAERRKVEDARREQEQRRKQAEDARRAKDEARRKQGKDAANATTTTTTTPNTEDPAEPAKPRRRRAGSGLRIAGLAIAGIGVAAVAGGVFFGLQSGSLADEVSKATVWTPELQQKDDDGRAAARNANILYAVGGAAVIGGGVLWYLGHRASARSERDVVLTPAITTDSVSLAVARRF